MEGTSTSKEQWIVQPKDTLPPCSRSFLEIAYKEVRNRFLTPSQPQERLPLMLNPLLTETCEIANEIMGKVSTDKRATWNVEHERKLRQMAKLLAPKSDLQGFDGEQNG